MTKQEEISALESRQLELQDIMRSSDAHAAKCVKLGKKYSTQYPEEYEGYVAANAEYNENEEALARLLSELQAEPENMED